MEERSRHGASDRRRRRPAVAVDVEQVELTTDGVLRLTGRARASLDGSRTGVLQVTALAPGRRRVASSGRYVLDRDGRLTGTVRSPGTARWSWLRWSIATPGVELRPARGAQAASAAGELRVLPGGLVVGRTSPPEARRAHLVGVDPATDGTLRVVLRSTGVPLEWAVLRSRRGPGEVAATMEPGVSSDQVAVFPEGAFATTSRRRHDLVAGWGSTAAEFGPPPDARSARAFPYRAVIDPGEPAVKLRVHRAEDGHVSLDVVPAGGAGR